MVGWRVDEVLHERLDFRSRSDLLVNVMLAIPLSFLLMAGFCADRSRTAALLAAPGVVLACVAVCRRHGIPAIVLSTTGFIAQ